MLKIENNEAIGVIFTQRIRDEEKVDAVTWTKGLIENSNVDPSGKVMQLLRVSTSKGGAEANKDMPGKTLRDFALLVAGSLGIPKACAVTRATDFKGSGVPCDVFFKDISGGKTHDRGLIDAHMKRESRIRPGRGFLSPLRGKNGQKQAFQDPVCAVFSLQFSVLSLFKVTVWVRRPY